MDSDDEVEFNIAKKIVILNIIKNLIEKTEEGWGGSMEKYYMKIIGTISMLNLEDC